jgi:hypothetical protein
MFLGNLRKRDEAEWVEMVERLMPSMLAADDAKRRALSAG